MIDKIEAFSSTKHLLSKATFNYLIDTVLINGLKSIALHGCYLKSLSEVKIKPAASLTLEYPFCQNDSAIRSVMVDAYIALYGHLFDSINISPQATNLIEDGIFNIVDDLYHIADVTAQFKKKLRVFLDLSCFENASYLFQYIDNIQSVPIDELIIGSSLSKDKDLNYILTVVEELSSSINTPLSFFGKLSSVEDLANFSHFDFKSILIPHNNLVNLLQK